MANESKVALVTGAARGIGRSIALRLAEDGCRVAINYLRNEAAAQEVAEAIKAKGGEAILLQGNVGESGAAADVVGKVMQAGGRLDVLAIKAGTPPQRSTL